MGPVRRHHQRGNGGLRAGADTLFQIVIASLDETGGLSPLPRGEVKSNPAAHFPRNIENQCLNSLFLPRSEADDSIQAPSFRDAPSGTGPESRDSGFDAEPVIGPRFARTRWHRPGMTVMGYARSLSSGVHSRDPLARNDGMQTQGRVPYFPSNTAVIAAWACC
jgi:hypothetical protein